jgi:hypothetical protein
MIKKRSRREFLADVGCGALVATLGSSVAFDLGVSRALAADGEGADAERLSFGPLEPLVQMMQETPVNRLLPKLTEKLQSGTDLRTLVAAAALANARTFGGEDYVGFHTLMALAPAYHMSGEMPEGRKALPVFKVLYRNTNRLQERGGRKNEVLRHVEPKAPEGPGGEALRAAVRRGDLAAAERTFAALAGNGPEQALEDLLVEVQDATEVHRTVLPYRAWDLLDVVGREHAHTLLRQSVRYCVQGEQWTSKSPWDEPRTLLPKMLEEHKLLGRPAGNRTAEDAWVEALSKTIFTSDPKQAAAAVAAALAEGFAPGAVGEAISLATNQLVLRDQGRPPREESPGKPLGSVHGDSIGVHASDSSNAWRNMSRVGSSRNTFACLILAGYQAAHDRGNRGGDFQNWQPLPLPQHLARVTETAPEALLKEAEEAIRGNLQARAAAVAHRYGELGHPARPLFDLMLKYAVSEDGSLHAEKYYRTVSEEFAAIRPAFRWRQLVALARVTASEYGRPAPGYAEAKELLKA